MNYHYINTDTDALKYSPHTKWIKYNLAFTSGENPLGYQKYGEEALGELEQGDILFMYADTIGIVAAGRVCESWNGHSYEGTARRIYQHTKYTEYRIGVDWCFTIPHNPIIPQEVRTIFGWRSPGWGWRGTRQRIKDENTNKAKRLLSKIQRRV